MKARHTLASVVNERIATGNPVADLALIERANGTIRLADRKGICGTEHVYICSCYR